MNEIAKTNDLDRAFIKQIAFEVDDGFTKTLPQAIVANFDEVKRFITEQTENDRMAVVTEESIDDFKKRKSLLNKQRDAINAQKIEIHKLWDDPYKKFEDKCRELLAVFDAAIANIDGQLKNFELIEKEKKRGELIAYWAEITEDIPGYRTYAQIENPKWLNRSTKLAVCKSEMDGIAENVRRDIEMIRALKSPIESVLFVRYKEGAEIREIITFNEAAKNAGAEIKTETAVKAEAKAANTASGANPLDAGDVITINMAVTGTAFQFAMLRGFLKENGIKFEKI